MGLMTSREKIGEKRNQSESQKYLKDAERCDKNAQNSIKSFLRRNTTQRFGKYLVLNYRPGDQL